MATKRRKTAKPVKRAPKKAAKKKAAKSKHPIKVTLDFHAEDFDTLIQVSRQLGHSVGTFIRDAINRRLQDVYDFRAIKNRCLHFAAGDDKLCVLCGETLHD